jgi:formylglycine-generating enzyme required for sulfatase activity
MRCPFCGQEHPDQAQFCPVTGRQLPYQTEAATMLETPAIDEAPRKKSSLILWIALALVVMCGLMVVLGAGGFLAYRGMQGIGPLAMLATATNTATFTPTMTFTPEFTPTPTFTPTPVPTDTPEPTPTPQYQAGSSITREQDGMEMMYVPEGEFMMGANDEDSYDDEVPYHPVYLSAFWMDKFEVTTEQYARCVNAGACSAPNATSSAMKTSYYGNSLYNRYPVLHIDWQQASDYCAWAGGRLATEAEWEKAARGDDGRVYPWGSQSPSCQLANMNVDGECVGDTVAVGSYPDGASPYGIMDLAGNVEEWIYDWIDVEYYQNSPYENPQGAASGEERGVRGGSWFDIARYVRTSMRWWQEPFDSSDKIGFRCVMDAP